MPHKIFSSQNTSSFRALHQALSTLISDQWLADAEFLKQLALKTASVFASGFSIDPTSHNFSTNGSTFNNVQRDYNRQDTHYHGDESTYNFTYGVPPNGLPEQQHRLTDGNGQTVPIVSGPFGGHLSGNQINNTWNYYTSPPTSPIPSPPSSARTPAQRSQTIASILDTAVKERGEQLNWRESIVDILKLLNLESSFLARQKLAEAVGYQGERNGSYAMNVHLLDYVKGVITGTGGNLTVARQTVARKMM